VVAEPARPGIKILEPEHADPGNDANKHGIKQLQRQQRFTRMEKDQSRVNSTPAATATIIIRRFPKRLT
jgi:hypothetical protein